MQRKYQLLVYGASGFTGRLCAKYLHENYPDLSWAIGGRNKKKLEQLRALDSGMKIGITYVENVPISVDTPEDLMLIEQIIKNNNEKNK